MAEKCPQSEVDFSQAADWFGEVLVYHATVFRDAALDIIYHCTTEALKALYLTILHNEAEYVTINNVS